MSLTIILCVLIDYLMGAVNIWIYYKDRHKNGFNMLSAGFSIGVGFGIMLNAILDKIL